MLAAVFIIAALLGLIGLRLLRIAWWSRGAEGWLGATFLCVAISMPVRMLLVRTVLADETAALLASHALMSAAMCTFTLFVDRVFRPDTGWASVITASLIGLQIAVVPAIVFFGGHRSDQSVASISAGMIRGLPFAWGFIESSRQYRQMRRRLRLGLADPVVTNRFALFSVWTFSLAALPTVLAGLRLFAHYATESGRMLGDDGAARLTGAIGLASLALLGGVAVVALFLSFFPPAIFIDRLEARAPAPVV